MPAPYLSVTNRIGPTGRKKKNRLDTHRPSHGRSWLDESRHQKFERRPDEEPPEKFCGIEVLGGVNDAYCLLYTDTSFVACPVALVPFDVTVVTFPSWETSTLDVPITLPPCFKVASNVLESMRLAEMLSAPLGIEPVMALSLPSKLTAKL